MFLPSRIIILLGCLFLLCGSSNSLFAGKKSSARPNILFFLTDDHRFDVMGCAGHPIVQTPTMDKLAKNGVRFRNAFVTTSICAASRASILTSMYERTHRFTFGTPPIRSDYVGVSYPMLLKLAGYRTGFIGKFGVSMAQQGQKKVFDFFRPVNRNPYFRKDKAGKLRWIEDIAGDHAVEFLQTCKKDQPWCLSISFNASHAEDRDKKNHYPYPESVGELYKDRKMPEPRLGDEKIFKSQPKFLRESMNRDRFFWRWDTKEKYQKNVRNYFRMLSGVDNVMARVLAEVENQGFADNTIVIFCGDNGYYLANRGFAGKWSHYEDSLRIPMIIFDPRLPPAQRGREVDDIALNVDVPATMLDYAGIKRSKLHQGHSLRPIVEGKKVDNWRTDFFCEHLMENRSIPKWEGVRGERWVYARYFGQKPAFEFLHDLKTDPDQLKNLAGKEKYAEQLNIMRKRCDALRDSYGGPYKPHPKKKKKANPKKKAQPNSLTSSSFSATISAMATSAVSDANIIAHRTLIAWQRKACASPVFTFPAECALHPEPAS